MEEGAAKWGASQSGGEGGKGRQQGAGGEGSGWFAT